MSSKIHGKSLRQSFKNCTIQGKNWLHCLQKGCTTITLADDAVSRSRLLLHSFKKPLITDLDSIKTHHYKGIKIHPYQTRSYIQCKNCPEIQPLRPKHIFECPAFTPIALNLGLTPLINPLQEIQNAPELSATFDGI
ncbi:hypothetical protein TNIN_58751 [Trichonephila inaurata madagascariensis]|uniref:Uncharacterized protein n=1 Tax=Trichonephila inaurata madagascariensis TaxID=2747483 RepID=A0A8X6XH21_9ARAC|nr:hypothetical protein TNIN_437811 [Trichonephila inaurata madagascariensis]GFY52542.1 hypothetical protein TNIN_58751 [Trichonephila inaurata madagascariensis]